MTVLLLQWLQGVNRFRHVRLQNTVSHRLNALEQVRETSFEISQRVVCSTCPFDRLNYVEKFWMF